MGAHINSPFEFWTWSGAWNWPNLKRLVSKQKIGMKLPLNINKIMNSMHTILRIVKEFINYHLPSPILHFEFLYQMKLGVKRRHDVERVFPPSRFSRGWRDDHDLVKYEDPVCPAGELEGRLWDHLQVTVVHGQDCSFGEDAGQDVQIGRGALYT